MKSVSNNCVHVTCYLCDMKLAGRSLFVPPCVLCLTYLTDFNYNWCFGKCIEICRTKLIFVLLVTYD